MRLPTDSKGSAKDLQPHARTAATHVLDHVLKSTTRRVQACRLSNEAPWPATSVAVCHSESSTAPVPRRNRAMREPGHARAGPCESRAIREQGPSGSTSRIPLLRGAAPPKHCALDRYRPCSAFHWEVPSRSLRCSACRDWRMGCTGSTGSAGAGTSPSGAALLSRPPVRPTRRRPPPRGPDAASGPNRRRRATPGPHGSRFAAVSRLR
jgi:hypothetical protein